MCDEKHTFSWACDFVLLYLMAIDYSNGLYSPLKMALNSFLSEKLLWQQGYNQHAWLGNEQS